MHILVTINRNMQNIFTSFNQVVRRYSSVILSGDYNANGAMKFQKRKLIKNISSVAVSIIFRGPMR